MYWRRGGLIFSGEEGKKQPDSFVRVRDSNDCKTIPKVLQSNDGGELAGVAAISECVFEYLGGRGLDTVNFP